MISLLIDSNLHVQGWLICADGHKPLSLAIVSSQCRFALGHSVAVPKKTGNGVFGTLGYVLGTFAAEWAFESGAWHSRRVFPRLAVLAVEPSTAGD